MASDQTYIGNSIDGMRVGDVMPWMVMEVPALDKIPLIGARDRKMTMGGTMILQIGNLHKVPALYCTMRKRHSQAKIMRRNKYPGMDEINCKLEEVNRQVGWKHCRWPVVILHNVAPVQAATTRST